MGLAIVYCVGFVTFFYIFVKYYLLDIGREINAETIIEGVWVALLGAVLWPLVLIGFLFMWLAPRIGL